MWREVLRVINSATVEGLSQSSNRSLSDDFLAALRHSNEVFSAFKVHQMGSDMAAKLLDSNGNLKPFRQWLNDVSSISTHHCGAWLRTEYDTAVIRAHNAADWQSFLHNKDVMPNLRWMPTTSPNPESSHEVYWKAKLTLPVDDPFWTKHHPGDRWNCKCSLEQTDDPVNRPSGLDDSVDQPQRGLENNPGKDGQTFSDNHPYYPASCSVCPFNKGSFKNRLLSFFSNHKKGKDCNNCPKVDKKLPSNQNKDNKKEKPMTTDERRFTELQGMSGKMRSDKLREIISDGTYKPVKDHKGVFARLGADSEPDYENQLFAADRAVEHGNTVYIMPNPGAPSPDLVFVRKNLIKDYELKTLQGKNSAGNRLKKSGDQSNRALLRMAVDYNARDLAKEVKKYFDKNPNGVEVLIYKGMKELSIRRRDLNKDFVKQFMYRYYK